MRTATFPTGENTSECCRCDHVEDGMKRMGGRDKLQGGMRGVGILCKKR